MRRPSPRLSLLLVTCAVLTGCEATTSPRSPRASSPAPPDATGAHACDEAATDAAVIRFRFDGECVSPSTLILYRCGPDDVPVLRLASARGTESFLGGPFAVRVTTLPADVRFVGGGEGVEVLVSDPPDEPPASQSPTVGPSEPTPVPTQLEPLVFVRQDGVTERWLRLVRSRRVADPPAAWLIGDSILNGGEDAVERALADWTLMIDAEDGRPSSQGVPLAARAVEQGADVVLVELGTNDTVVGEFRAHLVQTLELLRDVPLVLWQTARAPEELATVGQVNEAIREVVPRYPNTAIADWEAFVPEEDLMDDGIHPRDGAEGLESELLTPMLETWRGAVSGEGATACGRRVVRASS